MKRTVDLYKESLPRMEPIREVLRETGKVLIFYLIKIARAWCSQHSCGTTTHPLMKEEDFESMLIVVVLVFIIAIFVCFI